MNNITVNMENLSNNEREQLLQLVEKANRKPNPFKIEKGEEYYYIGCSGKIRQESHTRSYVDRNITAYGNACKDESYMERRAREIKLYNLLSNFAYLNNEGWEPDWGSCEDKFYIYKIYGSETYNISACNGAKNPNTVYFKSEELARRAINEVMLPFERGEL